MQVRAAVAAVALVLCASACTDGAADEPGAGSREPASSEASTTPEVTISCPEFEDAARSIAEAQAELYSGGDPGAVEDLVAELEDLQEGAPEDVRTALTDMADGFREAADLLADPRARNRAVLAELAPRLAADSETITAYITAQCG